jgi:tetratricopeptide (TPR) repeat protein
LSDYFRREGLAYRVMPVQQGSKGAIDAFNTEVMRKGLVEYAISDDTYYTDQHYGLRFYNLNDPDLFLLEDHRRLLPQYWMMYIGFAEHELYYGGGADAAVAVLDRMNELVPLDERHSPYWIAYGIARLYSQAGRAEKAQEFARRTIELLDAIGNAWQYDPYARGYHPTQIKAEVLVMLGEYDAAVQTFEELRKQYPDDPNLRAQIEQLRLEQLLVAQADTLGAIKALQKIVADYGQPTDAALLNNQNAFRARLKELADSAGVSIDTATSGDAAVDR